MRKLFLFTCGFIIACFTSVGFQSKVPAYAAAAVLTLAVFLCTLWRKKRPLLVLTFVCLGISVGLGWFSLYKNMSLRIPRILDGQTVSATVRVQEYGKKGAYSTQYIGKMEMEGKRIRIQLTFPEDPGLEPGDLVCGTFQFTNTAETDSSTASYLREKGVFLLGKARGDMTVTKGASELTELPALWRERILRILGEVFPEETAPFARALLLGDTEELNFETDRDLKISGIRHVVAVSGLHVSILFAMIDLAAMKKRFLTALLGLPALALFAALAGFSPSVTRASLMCGLMILGRMLNREYDSLTALAFSMLVMLVWNPYSVTSVSLQLSAASVAGIIVLGGPIRSWLQEHFLQGAKEKWVKAIKTWIAGTVAVSAASFVFTAPLCALYFGMLSLIGFLTNMLTLWLISGIFYGILLVCILYPIIPGISRVIALPVSWLIRYVLAVAGLFAKFPLAAIYTESDYIVAWLFTAYLLLAIFLLSRDRKPVVFICCTVLSLCAALTVSWLDPVTAGTEITVLDVGQGQCILLRSGGASFMVDCGSDRTGSAADTAAKTLFSQGVTRLDGLVITHLDQDHCGDVERFLKQIDTDLLILPERSEDWNRKTKGRVLYAEQDLTLSGDFGDLYVYASDQAGSRNEMSICVLFDTESCDILITGDRDFEGEQALISKHELHPVDVLIAGHHGSKNATGQMLLEAMQPEIVCISAGLKNIYGHPAPQTLSRLEQFGCTVYRTDLQGTIVIRR